MVDGEEVFLTTREWLVLAFLAARAGHVVSRDDVLEAIWQDTRKSSSNSLDVIIGRLRRKTGVPGGGCTIRTMRGEGFVFDLEP